MFFCLQSWKEVIVRIFISKSQYFWSQTSLIAPKESMMGTKSRHRAVMDQVGSLYILFENVQSNHYLMNACSMYRTHVPSIHRAKCVHQQCAYLHGF